MPIADKYNFTIVLSTDAVGTTDVALTWSGVPDPHQQFVNIYR